MPKPSEEFVAKALDYAARVDQYHPSDPARAHPLRTAEQGFNDALQSERAGQ